MLNLARTLVVAPLLATAAACSESVAAEVAPEPRERAAERVVAKPDPAQPSASPTSDESYQDGNATGANDNRLLLEAASLIQRDAAIPSVVKRALQVGVSDGRIIVRGRVPDEAMRERIDALVETVAPVQNEVVVSLKQTR